MDVANLPALLQASAAQRPEAEALVQGGVRVSYRELWRRVTAAAAGLQARGVRAAEPVALLHDNSIDYVVAYYAVLAAGAVVVPLNTIAKGRELRGMLRHSGAAWLIADPRHPEGGALAQAHPQLQVLRLEQLLAGAAGGADLPRPAAEQLAAIIYTSGTTGDPKGVMLSHGNLVSNTQAIVGYLGLTAADRGLATLPFPFSYGNSVLHTHLAAGACLVLESNLVYPQRLLAAMEAERITGFAGVPATFALLLARTRLERARLDSLRYLTQAGGPMAPAQVQRVRQLLPHARFFVMYGQTEATARLCYLPPEQLDHKPGSVGIPVAGVEIDIRDGAGRSLAAGEQGEVWARGPGIMQGYWRDPVASAAVLVDGWLRTGDLGYRDDDGFLYLRGRAVEMIKTGAYRVAPREIEEVVAELEGVEEAVAVGVPDDLLGQVIKVLVVSADSSLDSMRVLAHCRRQLAAYKVPRQVEFTTELPRTSSGKVKRHQLLIATTN